MVLPSSLTHLRGFCFELSAFVQEAYFSLHPDRAKADKFLAPLLVGELAAGSSVDSELSRDWRALREAAEAAGLFTPNLWFFGLHFLQLLVFEALAYAVFSGSMWGTSVFASPLARWTVGSVLLATAQAQAGWLQHDVGHFSVARTRRVAAWLHLGIISFMKGASSRWWNYRHFIHHSKPNVLYKDPDITLPYVFVLGTRLPLEWGRSKRGGILPYNWQHIYYHIRAA